MCFPTVTVFLCATGTWGNNLLVSLFGMGWEDNFCACGSVRGKIDPSTASWADGFGDTRVRHPHHAPKHHHRLAPRSCFEVLPGTAGHGCQQLRAIVLQRSLSFLPVNSPFLYPGNVILHHPIPLPAPTRDDVPAGTLCAGPKNKVLSFSIRVFVLGWCIQEKKSSLLQYP